MPVSILPRDYKLYGYIRVFKADRCRNIDSLYKFNRSLITGDEIVSFDCGLLEMREVEINNLKLDIEQLSSELSKDEQLLAIIIRPDVKLEERLSKYKFEFCGYDLVEDFGNISAITNTGGIFSNAIEYGRLTKYGLISNYKQAVLTQLELRDKNPNENHAYCDVIEVWRKLGESV
jgi:hypothetical protein